MDVLSRLQRMDKWFLGGGKGAIYAPPFPRHLLTPGFWDECYLADIRLSRLFCVLLLNDRARPVRVSSRIEKWRPDLLTLMHEGDGVVLRERRTVLECNAWVSELELLAGPTLDAFLWSLQEVRELGHGTPWSSLGGCATLPGSIAFEFATCWPSELEPDRSAVEAEAIAATGLMGERLSVFLELGADVERLSQTVNLAQRHDDSPLYELSVLPEKFNHGRLPGDFKERVGPSPAGLLHMLQHYRLEPGSPAQFACGSGLSADAASASLEEALFTNAAVRSEKDWRGYFASVPQFSSSDPFLTNAYWYRWYGLRLNTVDIPDLPIKTHNPRTHDASPFVTEGIGFFRNFVTYSAQAHLREVAWMHDPRLAIGILDNLTKIQREDGSFPGHNYSCRPPRDFYHADFAHGIWHLQSNHGRSSLPPQHVETFKAYAAYLLRERGHSFEDGPDAPLMCLIFDQNETGQEYMSRYIFAHEHADSWQSFKVCGVDASVYLLLLLTMLKDEDPTASQMSDRVYRALTTYALDRNDSYFCDVLRDGTRSPARPATGFYPFLAGAFYVFGDLDKLPIQDCLERWLIDLNEFWLPKGFPATALSDLTFSAEAEWKGKRLNCPWNGRSWPMVNSHIVDAIANVACWTPGHEYLRPKAGEALMKAVTLMFHDGDPARPNSYEHYNPFTGTPSLYRGYDDYMHSWIVDLILRYAVGVQPGKTEVDPLPLDVDEIECTDIPCAGGRMDVRIRGGRASVDVRAT